MNYDIFAQYQNNFYKKLIQKTNLSKDFYKNKIVLDVGCGKGEDSLIFSKSARKTVGIDIQSFPEWKIRSKKNLTFKIENAEDLSLKNKSFNLVFTKDMLHHTRKPQKALKEIQRITKKDGLIIIIEGNRYNPISYIHMTKLKGHEHFPQKVFRKMILDNFPNAKFYTFESHFIPFFGSRFLSFFFKLEDIAEKIPLFSPVLSYNIAIIKNTI